MSNFAAVRQIAGQMSNGYQKKVVMIGNVVGFDPVEYNKKGSQFQQVIMTDGTGEQCKVKIWLGKGPEIALTGAMTFDIGPNEYKGTMYYAGFWDGKVPAGAQPAAQNTQQAAQPVAQATNAAKADYDTKEALKQLIIKRGNSLNATMSATTIPQDLISNYLVASMGWLNNGVWELKMSVRADAASAKKSNEEQIAAQLARANASQPADSPKYDGPTEEIPF